MVSIWLNSEHHHQLCGSFLSFLFFKPTKESDYLFLKVIIFLESTYNIHEV